MNVQEQGTKDKRESRFIVSSLTSCSVAWY